MSVLVEDPCELAPALRLDGVIDVASSRVFAAVVGREAVVARPPVFGGQRSDEQLVARVRAGDDGAFEALAVRYQARLLWFCRTMLSSPQDAEDVLQDVFVAAYRAMLADGREIQVRPWLYQIARNRCLDQLRVAARIAADSIHDHSPHSPGSLAETVVMRQELRELLGDVQALPSRQRRALTLYELDDSPTSRSRPR